MMEMKKIIQKLYDWSRSGIKNHNKEYPVNKLQFKFDCDTEISQIILWLEFSGRPALAKRLGDSLHDAYNSLKYFDEQCYKGFGDYEDYDEQIQETRGAIYGVASLLEKIIALFDEDAIQDVIAFVKGDCFDKDEIKVTPKLTEPETAKPPASSGWGIESIRHSEDFRTVSWYGTEYSFTVSQARAVKILWEAFDNKTPDIGGETLIERIGSESSRPSDIFKGNSAWNTMICSGKTKGSLRLVEPKK